MDKLGLLSQSKGRLQVIFNKRFIGKFLFAFLLVVFFSVSPFLVQAQKDKDGTENYSPGSSTTYILNRYSALASTATAGTRSVTVSSIAELSGSTGFTNSTNPYATAALAAGDLVFIMQVQGADITTTDNSSYGAITAYNGVGSYELKTVLSVAGNTINFCEDLNNTYQASGRKRAQVIRVPRLNGLTVGVNGILSSRPWDGTIGGICVLEVDGNLVNNGSINVNGLGFRGGIDPNKASSIASGTGSGNTIYRTTTTTNDAGKGEGIAGNSTDYASLSGAMGRGAPANGGGGGNGHNTGGGGGANVGSGTWNGTGVKPSGYNAAWNLEAANFATNVSPGGGRGGYSYGANNGNALTQGPGNAAWGGDGRNNIGGFGGRNLDNATDTRLFFGGGGGAGDGNDNYSGDGGNGAGIIYLIVNGTISGTGNIRANGDAGFNTSGGHNDAPGGGGGGGAIVVLANSTITGITIQANGGNGGNQLLTGAESEGPGGGGSGGYILTTSTSVSKTVNGGNAGTSSSSSVTEFPPNGGTNGGSGLTATTTYKEAWSSCFSELNLYGCGTGYTYVSNLIKNGDFTLPITSPSTGNTYTASNNATAGTVFNFNGGTFRSQSDYAGGSSGHRFDIRTGNYTNGSINQDPFPGDPTNSVSATNSWMHHNGNNLGGEALIWEQTSTGLIIGGTYTFYFYASNVYNTSTGNDPRIRVRLDGTTGIPTSGTIIIDETTLTEDATDNAELLSGWVRFAYSFTATATSHSFKITNTRTNNSENEVGVTAIGLSGCVSICEAPQAASFTAAGTIINTYYPATSSVSGGATRIQVGTKRTEGAGDDIQAGDLLMVIQMQGSTMNSSNGNNYGANNGTPRGYLTTVAGTYEYVYAASSVVSGTVYLTTPLKNAYTNANASGSAGQYRFQVVRVPQYVSLDIANGANITNAEWNGTTGGIIAANVSGTMTFNGGVAIEASTLGFRGGGGRQLSGGSGASTDMVTLSSNNTNGSKGEGIAGTPKYTRSLANVLVDNGAEGYPNGSYAQGAPGNAGGGGTDGNVSANDENTGGGGGGNGGLGGLGGRAWNDPAQYGGYGGGTFNQAASTRLVLGGGGGAGTTNNGTGGFGAGFNSSGGSGGGMVFLKVGAVSGTGIINADGAAGLSVDNDGGGGGGAGGSVYLYSTNTSGLSNITINARGGIGGNAWASVADDGTPNNGAPEHGPGGGGGGGVIYTNGTINAASSVAGGIAGVTTTSNFPYGAANGATGIKLTSATDAMIGVVKTYCDIDDDDDGIADIIENVQGILDPFIDSDNDGIPNAYDNTPNAEMAPWVDVNGDGINDNYDADLDGIINELDLDSDNDGVADVVESYGVDADGDGKIDNFTDANGDGLSDNAANTSSTNGIGAADFDGDGIPNYLDLDSDNDGIPDIIESGGTDSNNDGKVDSFTDANFDGIADNLTGVSNALLISGSDNNNDGIADSWPNKNNDRTGRPNLYDLDSDGDGILDVVESGLIGKSGTNGTVAATNGIVTGTYNNGWAISVSGLASLGLTNTDANGQPDYLDIDSDNDGITDNVEAQSTSGYATPSDVDTDGDGINDVYETGPQIGVYGGGGLTPFDKDGDGTPDYRDTDTDNDGVADRNEGDRNSPFRTITQATINASGDTDGDGLMDVFDNNNITSLTAGNYYKNVTMSNMGNGGGFDGPTPTGSLIGLQQSDPSADRDWRNVSILPLNIISFILNYKEPISNLKWEVENEFQTAYYDVEYSADGNNFEKIESVTARNSNSSVYTLPHNLTNYTKNIIYYRVKQIDKNGKTFYTKTLSLKISRKAEIVVYPNPVKSFINIHYVSFQNEKIDVQIFSSSGSLVKSQSNMVSVGTNVLQIQQLDALQKGTYILKINSANNVLYTQVLIKE
ncbi:MAG: T9SS type A sorting domain-containing protein [Chitinophagaceae bacterium]